MVTTTSKRRFHCAAKYRSGLEERIAKQLAEAGIESEYEKLVIPYTRPESQHKYTPDWALPNGIIIESKGLFDADDRKKHLLVKAQYPHLDVRLVFSSSKAKLYKGSPTTYAAWCLKHGFKFADKLIPMEWLAEKKKAKRRR